MKSLAKIGLAATCIAAAVRGDNINVSKIVKGTYQSINFTTAAQKPYLYAVLDNDYQARAVGAISSQSSAYYLTPSWDEPWKPGNEFPLLQRSEATPAATQDLTYASPFWKLALVDMTTNPRKVQSRVFKSGNARSTVTYAIKIEHFGTTGDHFATVHVPTMQAGFQAGYSLCCPGDYNGGTYQYKAPDKVKLRTAVDMYVNGLPVWSSEKIVTYAESLATTSNSKYESLWGRAAEVGPDTLYLGRFQAGESMVISFVMRTNVESTAPDCGTAHYGQFSADSKRCTDATATILDNTPGGSLSLSTYVKAP